MAEYNYLNLGCGKRFHRGWVNVDMFSSDPEVKECNLLKGVPFADNTFEAVYHSHVLEHFSKEDGERLIHECFRVLQKDGIIRIAVPNLEKTARLYLEYLEKNMENSTPEIDANYDWMMIEFYDQCVRTKSGGGMIDYLKQDNLPNKDFVHKRIGIVARDVFEEKITPRKKSTFGEKMKKFWNLSFGNKLILIHDMLLSKILFGRLGRLFRAGQQRYSGEIHYWMYDRYSLTRLLTKAGFSQVKIRTAEESYIENWTDFELDTFKDGYVLKPDSIFIEARK